MKVILSKEVLGLGDPGEIVTVKNGYGRNYLLPQGMALEATKANIAAHQAQRKSLSLRQAAEAEKIRQETSSLDGVTITVKARAGESGRLYGSVTNMDLAAALTEQGFDIDRRRILLPQPIKKLGTHSVEIKLHPQVVVGIQVVVEPEAAPEVQAAPETEKAPAAEEASAAEETPPAEETAEAGDQASEEAPDEQQEAQETDAKE